MHLACRKTPRHTACKNSCPRCYIKYPCGGVGFHFLRYFLRLPSGQRSLCPAKPIKAFIALCLAVMQPAKNIAGSLPATFPDSAKHKKCFMLPFALCSCGTVVLIRRRFIYYPPATHRIVPCQPKTGRQWTIRPSAPLGLPWKTTTPKTNTVTSVVPLHEEKDTLRPSTRHISPQKKLWISIAPRCSATPTHTKTRCRIEVWRLESRGWTDFSLHYLKLPLSRDKNFKYYVALLVVEVYYWIPVVMWHYWGDDQVRDVLSVRVVS